jgi:tetratricopeptide (TPR) repeat protein
VSTRTSTSKIFLAGLAITLAGLAVYSNSFHGPFILDDRASIVENPTILHGWWAAWQPPTNGETVMGRPLVNWSLAVNYEIGGWSVVGYHVVNLAIHLLAGLVLFGLVRRTVELPKVRQYISAPSLPIAFTAALWWTMHPLQTASVTYIVQRSESLMGFFYLLTLYGFVRAAQTSSRMWYTLSVAACVLGGLSKEVIVTAPVMVLLYDRTFIGGTFKEAWQARRKYYCALMATWLPLGWLVWSAGTRGDSAGYAGPVSVFDYALAQIPAIFLYLRASIWPDALVFDYGPVVGRQAADIAPMAMLMVLLMVGTVWAIWRRPWLGFMGAWFFIILAPSSSVVPVITEAAAEHRMYLPLAGLIALASLFLWNRAERWALALTGLVALALGLTTWARNEDYRDPVRLWRSSLAQQPNVARAHENLGLALATEGRNHEALLELRIALRLAPNYPEAENNLGQALAQAGAIEEAAAYFTQAAQNFRRPHEQALAYFNLGNALGQLGRFPEALAAYTQSVALQPDFAPAQNLRGYVLHQLNRDAEAIVAYQVALYLQPAFPQCETNLGDAQAKLGRWPEAIAAYEDVLRTAPDFASARAGLEAAQQKMAPSP